MGPLRLKIRTAQPEHPCYTMRFLHLNNLFAAPAKITRMQCRGGTQCHPHVSQLQHYTAAICEFAAANLSFSGKNRCCRTKFLCGSSSSSNKVLRLVAHLPLLVAHLRRNSAIAIQFEGKIVAAALFFTPPPPPPQSAFARPVFLPSLGAHDGCFSRRQRVVSIACNAGKGRGWGHFASIFLNLVHMWAGRIRPTAVISFQSFGPS